MSKDLKCFHCYAVLRIVFRLGMLIKKNILHKYVSMIRSKNRKTANFTLL